MSHFDPILSGQDRTFLLIINDESEVGMALLDELGKPKTWAFGMVDDVLQDGFKSTNPGSVVLIPREGRLSDATNFWFEDDDIDTVLSVLNGPSSDSRGRLLAFAEIGLLDEFFRETDDTDEDGNPRYEIISRPEPLEDEHK